VVKKRDSVALFEVISKSRRKRREAGLGIPGWMGEDQEMPQGAPQGEAPGGTSPIGRAAPLGEPLVSTAGGRLSLSLNYVSCLVGVMVLVGLLVLAFWLGRATAGGAQTDSPEQSGSVGKQAPASTSRTSGYYYLVIQDLQGNTEDKKKEADRIVEFCKARGEPATVNTYKGSIVVWSLVGFNSPNEKAARDYAKKVEQLGQNYFQEYKTYDFRQKRAGRFDPLFLPYTEPHQ